MELGSRKGSKYAKIPLLVKIKLYKGVLNNGQSIKKISERLKIKYSTAKTMVQQFKNQELKIDMSDFEEETLPISNKKKKRTICSFFEINHQNDTQGVKGDEVKQNINAETFQQKIGCDFQEKTKQTRCFSRIQIISTTIWPSKEQSKLY